MLECKSCGKRHRDKHKLLECRVRTEKRLAREKARREDYDRRQENARRRPLRERVAELRQAGVAWGNVNSQVKADYPRPGDWEHECGQRPCPVEDLADKEWSQLVLLGLDSERFHWPMTDASVTRMIEDTKEYVQADVQETSPWWSRTIEGPHPLVWGSDITQWWYEQEGREDEDSGRDLDD